MGSVEGISCLQCFRKMLKQFLLVIVTVGLEATVTLEVILMIANIQTLGVPIRYSSLPGTVAAAVGIILIPAFGFIMDRWASSRPSKAKILVCCACIQLVGTALIFFANTIKLAYYDDVPTNVTSSAQDTRINFSLLDTLQSTSVPTGSKSFHKNETLSLGEALKSQTISAVSGHSGNVSGTDPHTKEFPYSLAPPDTTSGGIIHFYAFMAMIGYGMCDCGYDSSNCFLKTFALASTPPNAQSSIIVKAVLVSSFGGCLIAVLGSVGLGDLLTQGTMHDSNSAQAAFLSALCFTLVLTGLITSLTTGFCCFPDDYTMVDTPTPSVSSLDANEESRLISRRHPSQDLTASQQTWRLSLSGSANVVDKQLNGYAETHVHGIAVTDVDNKEKVAERVNKKEKQRSRLLQFIFTQRKLILLFFATLFLFGALYSFEVFATNYVGVGIFGGDPLADVGTEGYIKYIQGVKAGSTGTLIFYVTFTLFNSVQEVLLNKIGWKIVMLVSCFVFVVFLLTSSLSANLWAFYATTVWTGIYRAATFTVPFILANQFSIEQNGGQSTGIAIALISASLPCGFTVCSAIMGPLIDITGDPAMPLYYSAVNVLLGMFLLIFLKGK